MAGRAGTDREDTPAGVANVHPVPHFGCQAGHVPDPNPAPKPQLKPLSRRERGWGEGGVSSTSEGAIKRLNRSRNRKESRRTTNAKVLFLCIFFAQKRAEIVQES
jgi:hypothetical protein